eukprot:TRINITY_DN27981_c0_g1_i2.p1 TRINITY_DN27981_c0_g1~~TRINITY_DN27981_c0_g1_i2.p1  ORF type:complete len:220 (+),score=49.81 TRINITY_DN27981_c0_g1_i2:498-1157(+)
MQDVLSDIAPSLMVHRPQGRDPSAQPQQPRASTAGRDDEFDSEGNGWESIIRRSDGPVANAAPTAVPAVNLLPVRRSADADEFGSFAVTDDMHSSIMQHVNAALQLRPGTTNRERRAAERAKQQPAQSPHRSPAAEDDFSDTAATVSSQNLRSLLVIELGDRVFNKVHQLLANRANVEEDEELHTEVEQMLGDKAQDLAPLLYKLVLVEENERQPDATQ